MAAGSNLVGPLHCVVAAMEPAVVFVVVIGYEIQNGYFFRISISRKGDRLRIEIDFAAMEIATAPPFDKMTIGGLHPSGGLPMCVEARWQFCFF